MRILYFSRSYTPHDFRFLSAIVEGGHQAFFLRLDDGKAPENRPLPLGVGVVSGYLKDVIAEVKPDLIHAGPLTDCGYQATKSSFHPIVQMSWGSDILWEARRNAGARKRVRFALNHSDAVIGDCKSVKQAVMKFGVPVARIVTFPWGVDLSQFTPVGRDGGMRKKLGWEENFVLLHLRSWESIYDPLTVVRAFAGAARQNSKLRLLMPGNGSLKSKISGLLKETAMQDRVCLPGQVSQDELPDYFRTSDIYISASQSDGSSVSLMEAMACGLPALVSDIPGNREWVKSGRQGWLFPAKDAVKLQELILKASRSTRLKEIGKQSRQIAMEKANWDENKRLLNKAYKLAVANAS